LFFAGILKVNDENSRIRIQDPEPLVSGMDPRIRIHTKMSWIRNTELDRSETGSGFWISIGNPDPGARKLTKIDANKVNLNLSLSKAFVPTQVCFMTYYRYLHKVYFSSKNSTVLDVKVWPRSGSGWIRIGFALWMRIRIKVKSWIRIPIETNQRILSDPEELDRASR
jgi:hypothetical protein